jgi:uncharacterized protein (TIGR03382 family)
VRGEPPRPDYDAELVGVDHPAEMVSGEEAVAWVEMRNTGGRTWDLSSTWLGTTSPRDHASPFFDADNWLNDHRATAPDHSTYSTGTVGRFSFVITAPEVGEETVITDTFGLVQEGVSWFGPEDVTFSITVRPAAAMPPPAEPDGGTVDPPPTGPDDPPTTAGDAGVPPPEGPRRIVGGCSAAGSPAGTGTWLLAAVMFAWVRRRSRP